MYCLTSHLQSIGVVLNPQVGLYVRRRSSVRYIFRTNKTHALARWLMLHIYGQRPTRQTLHALIGPCKLVTSLEKHQHPVKETNHRSQRHGSATNGDNATLQHVETRA